jgi:hypothetical protein
VCPLGRNICLGEYRLDGTLWNTGIAIDARVRIDVQHVIVEMKSLDGTDQGTVSVTAVHTWFCNDVSHSDAFSLKQGQAFLPVPLYYYRQTYINHELQILKDGSQTLTPLPVRFPATHVPASRLKNRKSSYQRWQHLREQNDLASVHLKREVESQPLPFLWFTD